MQLFLVQRTGVYEHGIVHGVFTTMHAAENAMDLAVECEPDDHHEFHILEVESDRMYKFKGSYMMF